MEDLFIMESELLNFKYRHPEYNTFEKVYHADGEFAGYIAKVTAKTEK